MYFYILISIICYSFEILCYDNEILLKNKECFNIENELEFDYDKNGYKILKGNLKIYYSDVYQNFINISNILKNIFNRNNISYISISGIKNSIQFEFNFLKYGNEFEMMINIDLFNCDEFLRYYYNLTKEDTLFISQLFILDLNNEKRFLLKYIIYDNNQVLNLNICDQNKKYLKIVYPLSLLNLNNEYYRLVKHLSQKKINILNKNEPFYNDICFSFSFNNKDISIDDRRKLFFKNFSICEGCSFSDINYNKNQILCLCSYNMEYNFDKPFEKISFINFKIMKCYHNFFNIKLFKNIGFYIELSFLIISIVFEIHWYYFSSSLINNKILKILSKKSNKNSMKNKIFSKRNLVNFTMKTQTKLTSGINSSNLLLQSNLDFSKNTISENSKLSLNKSIIQTVVNAPSEINNITIINNNSILEKKSTIHRCVNIEHVFFRERVFCVRRKNHTGTLNEHEAKPMCEFSGVGVCFSRLFQRRRHAVIEDTINAVKEAEAKARDTAAKAREDAKNAALEAENLAQKIASEAKNTDKSYYDSAMASAKSKADSIIEDAKAKADSDAKALTAAADSKIDSAVNEIVSRIA